MGEEIEEEMQKDLVFKYIMSMRELGLVLLTLVTHGKAIYYHLITVLQYIYNTSTVDSQ